MIREEIAELRNDLVARSQRIDIADLTFNSIRMTLDPLKHRSVRLLQVVAARLRELPHTVIDYSQHCPFWTIPLSKYCHFCYSTASYYHVGSSLVDFRRIVFAKGCSQRALIEHTQPQQLMNTKNSKKELPLFMLGDI